MSKNILLLWTLATEIRLYSLLFHESILLAHGGFIGTEMTPEQDRGIRLVKNLMNSNKQIGGGSPISANDYSFIVICGEFAEIQ